ncbi:MAG: NB-ARC domain-containing protein [Actinomycetota bacterium]
MTTQIPQDFVQAIAKERSVTDAELETVFMALDGQSTAAIATRLEISDIAVRKRLGEVYKKFKISGSGPGKLAELRHQLLFLYQAGQQTNSGFHPASRSATATVVITHRHQDWGEAPDVSAFYGRAEELLTLGRWIVSDSCRLVAVLGLSGIGKTTLSVKLAKQLQDEFDFVLWRSLRAKPLPEDLIGNLLQFLSNQQKLDLPEDLNTRISRLVEYLRKQKCLLILDDFEAVLKAGQLAGHYREGYEGYRELIGRLGKVNHHSCLLLISSEEPTELALLASEKVRTFKPIGSEEIAREFFKEKGLSAHEKEWKILMNRYGGNLLALKIVAATIQEFFDGSVFKFLEATALFLEDHISHLLAQQLERLSPAEEDIMYWLALERYPVSMARLREDIVIKSPLSELVKNLESLGRRSLIEKITESGETLFTLQPLIMKYVTDQLAERVQEELLELIKTQTTDRLRLLKSHNLFKASPVKGKGSKANQTRSLINLVKNRLQALFIKTAGYEEQLAILTKITSSVQDKPQLEVGYASENLRNVLSELANA